jgi:hypothetical protein
MCMQACIKLNNRLVSTAADQGEVLDRTNLVFMANLQVTQSSMGNPGVAAISSGRCVSQPTVMCTSFAVFSAAITLMLFYAGILLVFRFQS